MPVNPCLFINVYFIHVCFRSVHLYLFYSTFLFQIGILKQFTFTSKLQRMSVITRQNNLNGDNFIVYSKGSPEMISSLSLPYTGTSVTVARTSFQILEIFLGKIMSIPFFKYPILKCSYTTGASEKTSWCQSVLKIGLWSICTTSLPQYFYWQKCLSISHSTHMIYF